MCIRDRGNVAHELKTPIFNIQGYISTLLDGGLEDELINRKYLERAEKSIDRLINIVNDLDTISKDVYKRQVRTARRPEPSFPAAFALFANTAELVPSMSGSVCRIRDGENSSPPPLHPAKNSGDTSGKRPNLIFRTLFYILQADLLQREREGAARTEFTAHGRCV